MPGTTLDSYQHLQQLPQSNLKWDTVTSILLMGSWGKKKGKKWQSTHSPWRATESGGSAGVKPPQKIDTSSSTYQSSMEAFWSKTDTCVISTASVLGMRLCQYKISTRDRSQASWVKALKFLSLIHLSAWKTKWSTSMKFSFLATFG